MTTSKMRAEIERRGFELCETGGGASAYILNVGAHDVYITDDDGNAPHDPAAPVVACWWDKAESPEVALDRFFDSAESLLAWFGEIAEEGPLCAVLGNLDGIVTIKGG